VLEVMHAVETASREGRHVEIVSTVERPAPMLGSPPPPLRDT